MMKRTTIWLFIAFLTFGLGMTATLAYLKFNASITEQPVKLTNPSPLDDINKAVDIPTLSYCELSTNPQNYDGKIVRLSSTLLFGIEGSWFSDSTCETSKGAALLYTKNEEVWKPISEAREQKNNKFLANELNLTVVGKFKNVEAPKNGYIIVPFQFEILKVEKTSKTN